MNQTEIKHGKAVLESICGARLTSVQFVLDYLILGFDMKGALTSLVWPKLITQGGLITFETPGYRDHLCKFITREVVRVEISSDETITINFHDKTQIIIVLQSYKRSGERAIFKGPKHILFVW